VDEPGGAGAARLVETDEWSPARGLCHQLAVVCLNDDSTPRRRRPEALEDRYIDRRHWAVLVKHRLPDSMEETSGLLGISRSLGYKLPAQGRLPTVRLGRRVVVPRAALERLLAGDSDPVV
jgi:excisionase family DNA binding protein